MKLLDYMELHDLTNHDLAAEIERATGRRLARQTIGKLAHNRIRPSYDTMAEIAIATHGQVRPDDWFGTLLDGAENQYG